MPRESKINPLFNQHHLLLLRKYVYWAALLAFFLLNAGYTFDAISGILRTILTPVFGTELTPEEKNWYLHAICLGLARLLALMFIAHILVLGIDRFEPAICETRRQIIRKRRRNKERLAAISEKSELLHRIEAMVRERVKDRELLSQYHDAMTEVLLKFDSLDAMKSPRRKAPLLPEPSNDLFNQKAEEIAQPKKKRFVPNLLRRRKPPEF